MVSQNPHNSQSTGGTIYQSVEWPELEGWADDDHGAAFAAFLTSARRMLEKPYRQGSGPVDIDSLLMVARKAVGQGFLDRPSAQRFFENNFKPHLIVPVVNSGPESNFILQRKKFDGFVTGFFEPVVAASRKQTPQFPVPLLRRPDDLIDVDDSNRPGVMSADMRFGHSVDGAIVPYFDRPAIQAGALDNRGLELAFVKDKTAAFFIHVQGSARLTFDQGPDMRVTYAAKSGHPYTSVAKVLCAQTGIAPETMTADRLADWMRAHPDQIDSLLAHNKSYIFFREAEGLSVDEGPVAAAKVPLIAGRSLAIDRLIHPFGTPFWVATSQPLAMQQQPFARLMMAHDTGSAIVGAARGDLFMGSGDEAGLVAGRIRHRAAMTVLVPKK